MIEIKDVSKQFGKTRAVDHVSFSVKEENVFGLIGTNGAGKSTMLRMLAGVLKPDAGLVLIDGMQVYDNVNAKKMFFFIGDEPYFFSNATPRDMEKYYSSVFAAFSRESYYPVSYTHLDVYKRQISSLTRDISSPVLVLSK